jgi:hypothetical protein
MHPMEITLTGLAVFAVVATLGILGAVGVNILLITQEINAVKPPTQGCRNSIAVNASQGRCFHG